MNDAYNVPGVKLRHMLVESARRSSQLHGQFLQVRQTGLQDLRKLIGLQIQASGAPPANPAARPAVFDSRPGVFDSRQLDEFGTGSLACCLGSQFAQYEGRRIPRIPNGDLKMMSRVVEISGQRFGPAHRVLSGPAPTIAVEFDVPSDAWYFRDAAYPSLPYSLYMEAALQPCGFLSAYLDTYSLVPHGEFFFRNLDGSARLIEAIDLRGQTILTRARMLTSVVSSGTVIQKFAFEISCAGRPIYAGESTFGYFSAETMANQVGLDGGRPTSPALRAEPGLAQSSTRLDLRRLQATSAGRPHYHLAHDRLHLLDDVFVNPHGGRCGQGYLYASRPVNPRDWFYPFHFYQDPVMPGSLGVEAVLEAMQAYAISQNLGGLFRSPHFIAPAVAQPMTWRYRGQITQQHRLMELEVHLSGLERQAGGLTLLGDASLWVDGLRIYEMKNAAVGIMEG